MWIETFFLHKNLRTFFLKVKHFLPFISNKYHFIQMEFPRFVVIVTWIHLNMFIFSGQRGIQEWSLCSNNNNQLFAHFVCFLPGIFDTITSLVLLPTGLLPCFFFVFAFYERQNCVRSWQKKVANQQNKRIFGTNKLRDWKSPD